MAKVSVAVFCLILCLSTHVHPIFGQTTSSFASWYLWVCAKCHQNREEVVAFLTLLVVLLPNISGELQALISAILESQITVVIATTLIVPLAIGALFSITVMQALMLTSAIAMYHFVSYVWTSTRVKFETVKSFICGQHLHEWCEQISLLQRHVYDIKSNVFDVLTRHQRYLDSRGFPDAPIHLLESKSLSNLESWKHLANASNWKEDISDMKEYEDHTCNMSAYFFHPIACGNAFRVSQFLGLLAINPFENLNSPVITKQILCEIYSFAAELLENTMHHQSCPPTMFQRILGGVFI